MEKWKETLLEDLKISLPDSGIYTDYIELLVELIELGGQYQEESPYVARIFWSVARAMCTKIHDRLDPECITIHDDVNMYSRIHPSQKSRA